ncbi:MULTISPECIES: sulfite exporter TauE/SafE family protein [Desulfitobacterium]|uniref:Probable membrane transporter protein n=1 Tax=Desulfitobacterium dehalogenans (strain ATCC 51507 / DSM 9161 / JW/IU-DC1) TaxID=756499 RepID=I4A7H2_DESDJ|nr:MULTISPECIES: sulfite exporter TauE/SafE family protein [Desulfitobacterium]AFL99906.1 putative permease [Desulfitobacterium dehalogenans ATCC 51507]
MELNMDYFLQMLDLSRIQCVVVIITAFLVGFSKTGINGVIMLVIPILASAFGGKDSTGILLPILLVGDVFAVWSYRKSVDWKKVFAPLPWALIGLFIGAVVGKVINDQVFIILIGIIIIFCLGILMYTEKMGKNFTVPTGTWFYITAGILSGFATMIGNAAGPIFSVYLLALGLQKNDFMGTNAWFFFIINFIKVPVQIFAWHNIELRSFILTAVMTPIIALGAVLGFFIIKKINEKFFRHLIICMTALSALRLFV